MQPRSIALLQRVDSNIDMLLQKIEDIIEKSHTAYPSKELTAVTSLEIDNSAAQIIRIAEELLTISRVLKESWLLGSLNTKEQHEGSETDMTLKVNQLIDKITTIEKNETDC